MCGVFCAFSRRLIRALARFSPQRRRHRSCAQAERSGTGGGGYERSRQPFPSAHPPPARTSTRGHRWSQQPPRHARPGRAALEHAAWAADHAMTDGPPDASSPRRSPPPTPRPAHRSPAWDTHTPTRSRAPLRLSQTPRSTHTSTLWPYLSWPTGAPVVRASTGTQVAQPTPRQSQAVQRGPPGGALSQHRPLNPCQPAAAPPAPRPTQAAQHADHPARASLDPSRPARRPPGPRLGQHRLLDPRPAECRPPSTQTS